MGKIKGFLYSLLSRKFLMPLLIPVVSAVAGVMVHYLGFPADQAMDISQKVFDGLLMLGLAYIGVEGAADTIARWKNNGK